MPTCEQPSAGFVIGSVEDSEHFSLDPCECFGEQHARTSPVTESSSAAVPRVGPFNAWASALQKRAASSWIMTLASICLVQYTVSFISECLNVLNSQNGSVKDQLISSGPYTCEHISRIHHFAAATLASCGYCLQRQQQLQLLPTRCCFRDLHALPAL